MTAAHFVLFVLAAGPEPSGAETTEAETSTTAAVVVQGIRRRPDLGRPQHLIDLEDRPLRFETLGDVMAEVPGVTLFDQGGLGGSKFLSIRGADFEHTVVLIDDVPVTGPDRGAVDFSLFPIDGFASIEVFRGSAPIRFGAGTIGGVVRLVPKDSSERRLSGRGSVGSFGTQEARVEGEGGAGDFGWLASGGALRSKNDFTYLDDNATFADTSDDRRVKRVNAQVAQGHGFFAGRYESGPHRLAAFVFALHQDRGLPGPATVVSRDSEEERSRAFASLGYRLDLDVWDMPLNAFATVAVGYDRDQVQDPLGRIGLGPNDADDRFSSLDARLGAFLRILPPLTVGATAFRRRDDLRPNDRFATPGDQPSERDLTVASGEALLEVRPLDVPVSLRGSASVQVTEARITASAQQGTTLREIDETAPNYRLELRAGPLDGFEFSSLVSSGVRLPTVLQLFGNRDTVAGNPGLLPETSLSADAGLGFRRSFGRHFIHSELRVFWLQVQDIIVARRTAQNTVVFRNERAGEARGLEAELSFGLAGALFSTASFTYLDSEFDNAGFSRVQPLRVPWRFFQQLRYKTPVPGLELWSEIHHRSGFFADSANQVEQAPLSLVHAGLKASAEGVSVAVLVRNLFDELGQDLLAFPRPGRAFEVTLQWQENFL